MSAVVRRRDPRGDPLFDRVNLLITGNTQLKDESRSNTTLTTGAALAVQPMPHVRQGSGVRFYRSTAGTTLAVPARFTKAPFCVEGYMLVTQYPHNSGDSSTDMYSLYKSYRGPEDGFALELKWFKQLGVFFSGSRQYPVAPDIFPLNVPVHWALSADGSTYRLFQNGRLQWTTEQPGQLHTGANHDIGFQTFIIPGRSLDGWLRDIRVTAGDPRYTKDFSPPPLGFSTFGVESRAAVIQPFPIEEPEPEPDLGTESCASIVTAGLGGTVKPFMVTRGLGLCPGLPPVAPPPPPPMTLYYEPEQSDQKLYRKRRILREDQLLLEVIMLAVTRVLR